MPRQVDHDARRDAVCDAVVDLAARDGFTAVTIRAVAARAGASTSVVTHYVSGREELLRLAVRREIGHRRAQLGAAVTGRTGTAGLRALAESAVLDTAERAQRFWLALVTGAHAEPVLRAELDTFNTWWDALVERLLREARPAPPDPAALADALDVVVGGLVVTGFEGAARWSRERRRRALDALLAPLGL